MRRCGNLVRQGVIAITGFRANSDHFRVLRRNFEHHIPDIIKECLMLQHFQAAKIRRLSLSEQAP
jgi:hypothetical protein